MTIPNERRYGEKRSYPIYVWNGLLERKHVKTIGPAIWLFLWLINAVTREIDGRGFVLGGAPINCANIGISLGLNEQTVRAHLDRLEEGVYIERIRTPRGYSVRVLNSAKFPGKRTISGRNAGRPDRGKVHDRFDGNPDHIVENPRCNKSKQRDESSEEAVGCTAASPFWKLIQVKPESLPTRFVEICEVMYAKSNGIPLGELMGACMDEWQASGGKHPRTFVRAKIQIVARERDQRSTTQFLAAKPFMKRDWTMEDIWAAKS